MKEYTVKVYDDGSKFWCLNDLLHREDGPAIEYADGSKSWYLNGKLHREDGPALEFANGSKAWYLSGTKYTEAEFLEKTKKVLTMPSCAGKVVEIDGKKYKLMEI